MTISIKPSFQSAITDDPSDEAAGRVTPGRWNAGSDFTMATGKLIGRTSVGDGAAEEIDLDTDGTLAADSDTVVSTQKAVKTYVDTEIGGIQGAAYTLLASYTAAGGEAAVSFTGIDATDVIIYLKGVKASSSSSDVILKLSTDNGSTYSTTGYALLGANWMSSTSFLYAVAYVFGLKMGAVTTLAANAVPPASSGINSGYSGSFGAKVWGIPVGAAVNALRIALSSGSFTFLTGSTIELWGR